MSYMIKNFRHTGIVVDDLEKSMDFYVDKLGFEVQKVADESGEYIDTLLGLDKAMVKTVKMTLHNDQMIELLDFTSHKLDKVPTAINRIGPTHMAFTVSDLNKVVEEFTANGIEFISEPVSSPDGYAKVAFCKAPEGTYIELVELKEGP